MAKESKFYRLLWRNIDIWIDWHPCGRIVLTYHDFSKADINDVPWAMQCVGGYRSLFIEPDVIPKISEDVTRCVSVWLDSQASQPGWASGQADRQGSLF